jgi:hypothetical protein
MNGLHDLLATLKKIEEAGPVGPQAQYDPATQTLTYNGKQYKKASGFTIHNGIPLDPVVTAPPIATGSRTYGDTVNVVLKPDGTYYETKYSPEQAGPAVAPADGKDRVPAPETPQQVYDRNDKAKLAQQMLKTQVKSRDDLGMVNGYYIEKETGTLLHHMIANDRGGQAQGTVVKFANLDYGQGKEFLDQLTSIGLVPQPKEIFNPGIFNWKWTQSKYVILQINLQDLTRIAQNQPPTMEKPPAPPPPVDKPPVNQPPVNQPPVPAPANDQQALPGDNAGLNRFRELINKAQGIEGADKLESIKFKSLIGRTLLAELSKIDYLPANQVKPQTVANVNVVRPVTANDQQVATGFNGGQIGRMFGNLTAAEVAEGDKLYQSYGDSRDPEIMNLLKQWSEIKNNMLKAGPSPVKPDPAPVKPDPAPVKPEPAPVKPEPAPVKPEPAPVKPEPAPVKPEPIKPVPINPVKPNADQQQYPSAWINTPIEVAPRLQGMSPEMGGTYYLGKGTPDQVIGFNDRRNNTLVVLVPNSSKEDKRYTPIPWGDKRFSWPSARGGVTERDPQRPGLDPKKGKPEVYDRQKQLQDAGALNTTGKNKGKKLTLDGIDGDNTKAAEKAFGAKLPAMKQDAPPPEGATDKEIISFIEKVFPQAVYHNYYWVNGRRWRLVADGKGTNRYIWTEDNPYVFWGLDGDRRQNKYTGPNDSPEQAQQVEAPIDDAASKFAQQQAIKMLLPDVSPTAQRVMDMAKYYRAHPNEIKYDPKLLKENGYSSDELNRIISLVHHR